MTFSLTERFVIYSKTLEKVSPIIAISKFKRTITKKREPAMNKNHAKI